MNRTSASTSWTNPSSRWQVLLVSQTKKKTPRSWLMWYRPCVCTVSWDPRHWKKKNRNYLSSKFLSVVILVSLTRKDGSFHSFPKQCFTPIKYVCHDGLALSFSSPFFCMRSEWRRAHIIKTLFFTNIQTTLEFINVKVSIDCIVGIMEALIFIYRLIS